MHKMPPTVPISNLRNEQDEILSMMDEQPVMLTQRGKARATLVSIELWNQLMDVLAMYRASWRAESARVQDEMAGEEWIDAAPSLDEYVAKNGVGKPMPVTQNQAAIALVDEWLADTSGYDEEAWPVLKQSIEENRLSARKQFND